MVELDLTGVILPIVVPIAVLLIALFAKKFSQTSEGTLTGTIRLEHVNKDVDGVKKDIIEIWKKISELDRTAYNNVYRLNRLENKNGKSAV